MTAIDFALASVTAVQTEIALLFLAMCTYQVAFGVFRVPRRKPRPGLKCIESIPKTPVDRPDAGNGKTSDDVVQKVSLIKAAANKGNLPEALHIFESCETKVGLLYNTIIDACVNCGDVAGAERIASDAQRSRHADITTYNTLMKVYLRVADFESARRTIAYMRSVGLEPNCVTFNELIDATMTKSFSAAWRIVDEMNAAGVKPNRITCSILLKSAQASTGHSKLEKVLHMIGRMEEEMDEILYSSVIEGCVRANRIDILKAYLNRQQTCERISMKSSHAYGSLIRGYGAAQDLAGVWSAWREMREQCLELTSKTVGCMVEAVATNAGAEEGYRLILELSADPEVKPLINAIIYGSVLKGFSHEKQFDRAWDVYQAMRLSDVELTVTTYNTLIDACARSGEMHYVPEIISEMMQSGIQPNIITYSAMIKGYCLEHRIDQALDVMAELKRQGNLQPDEHTYNTVINGCARQGRYEKGLAVFEEMCQDGVKPSNFTLSVLVKLASRSKRVDKAFALSEEVSKRFGLRLNVHVYNNLVQACLCHKGLSDGLQVVERMLKENVRLDVRTYSLLLHSCVEACSPNDAAGLIRAAMGLEGVHHRLVRAKPSLLRPPSGLPVELLTEVLDGIAHRCRKVELAGELLQELRKVSGLKLSVRLNFKCLSG